MPFRSRSKISEARSYSPRGNTIRESARRGAGATVPAPRAAEPKPARPKTPTRAKAASPPPRQRKQQPARKPPKPKKVLRGVKRPPKQRRRLRVPRLGNPGRRLRFSLAVTLLLFAVLAGRLVQIQTSDGAKYAAAAAQDRMVWTPLIAPRGSIVDRNGYPLASSVAAVFVDVDPTKVEDVPATAAKLSPLIGIPESTLSAKMTPDPKDPDNQFVYLARQLDPEIGDAVSALKLAGIHVREEQRRHVPGHDLAANLLGFTNSEGKGTAGIEESYDEILRGTDGERRYETGLSGQEIPGGQSWEKAAKPGQDVQLTIDRDLQYEAQKVLRDQMRLSKATTGSIVAMDVKTGEILAMASYPTYDAAQPGSSDQQSRMDQATGTVIEPGSVHKVITLGAALEEDVIQPDSTVFIGPTIRKGGTTFTDTHWHGKVNMTLQGILAQSSNVGTITIADKLGSEKLYEYQRKFGLGTKTGVGLPGESGGLVQPPNQWSAPSYGSIPIGLGVAVTPLQMTSVYATIANGGVRTTPSLVKQTTTVDGKVTPVVQPKSERVLSAENAAALREDLEAVVSDQGTAPQAAIDGYRVAGKTGTGLRAEDNKYLPGNTSSFIGMVPADNPRFVIGVFVYSPAKDGAKVAAPAFSQLGGFMLRHYGVAPTGTTAPPIKIYG